MILIYFDEAKEEAAHPHYQIGAVAVREEHLRLVEERIAGVARGFFGTSVIDQRNRTARR